MCITNKFDSAYEHSKVVLGSLKQLIERLSFDVSQGGLTDINVHLPIYTALKHGRESVDCIKFGARYYTLDSGFRSNALSLVNSAQGVFLDRFSIAIDDLTILNETNGKDSTEFLDLLVRTTEDTFYNRMDQIPDSLIKARMYDLTYASECLRVLRSQLRNTSANWLEFPYSFK